MQRTSPGGSRIAHVWHRLRGRGAALVDAQRGHLFVWSPVCLGIGIGTYFALPQEPGLLGWGMIASAFGGMFLACLYTRLLVPILVALTLVLAGGLLAGARTQLVADPVLGFRYYGPIEGRILAIDRSASDKMRLTLDRVVLARVSPGDTPAKVRLSLHGDQRFLTPSPGMTIVATGHLSAPRGPVEPGGFDFQRHAWFQGLGAVGYTRTPVLAVHPPEGRWLVIHRVRMAISAHVQGILPGRTGAFAAAITTGDRSGMDLGTLEALRISNLAHLLAISGLHMGMLTGFVFGAVRLGLALVPHAALFWPIHKVAAHAGLAAGALYLALSGGNVATERAFIMVAVMLVAVLFDQRALTLRAVALAAVIVLVRRPEALLGPGFQMSFAATAALIAVFAYFRDRDGWRLPRMAGWVAALVISSAVAGLATAPFAAAHFNRVPHFGLIANLASVPVMGALVMPAAVLAAVLAPLGLSWVGLKVMAPGIAWILSVADEVSGWDGAVSHVPAPQAGVLPMLALGALFVILWQGRVRIAGVVPVIAALALWSVAERPVLLVSESGGLVGVMTAEGRALSKPRGEGFAAQSWLENDGDGASQPLAHERWQVDGAAFDVGDTRFWLETGRGARERALADCSRGSGVVITSADLGNRWKTAPCTLYDSGRLAQTGPLAAWMQDGKPVLRPTRKAPGSRPWIPADQ
ncbi:MAG: DUF4131 domain-containing protein [Rhodobacteraceae bacterium]|nr:DUF4131 domain-containing protein [Paracoccaceae bacterium]